MYKDMIPAGSFARETHPRESAAEYPRAQEDAVLEQHASEIYDLYLRLSADFENYKRRVAQESERRGAARKEAFVRELLPVFDNLERALANCAPLVADPLRDGVKMTFRQFLEVMRSHGFEPHGEVGRPFDPNYHEAACVRSEAGRADQSIVEVWQRGWMHEGKLFRAAKVVVNDSPKTWIEPSSAETKQLGSGIK